MITDDAKKSKFIIKLSLDLFLHFSLTFILSWWIYAKTASLFYIFMFALGGIFIDLDHLVDYFLFYKDIFSIKNFFKGSCLKESGKIYLFLHSWEIVIVLLIASLILKSGGLFIFSSGLCLHLSVDNLLRRKPLLYFLSHRFARKFDLKTILPEYDNYF